MRCTCSKKLVPASAVYPFSITCVVSVHVCKKAPVGEREHDGVVKKSSKVTLQPMTTGL